MCVTAGNCPPFAPAIANKPLTSGRVLPVQRQIVPESRAAKATASACPAGSVFLSLVPRTRLVPYRHQDLQMSAAESYRQWRGRKAPTLLSGEYRSHTVATTQCGILEGGCSTPTHYINFAGQLLGTAVPPLAAMPCDSQSNCELKKAPSIKQLQRLLRQNSRDGHRSQRGVVS
jgi:hypothetical protein